MTMKTKAANQLIQRIQADEDRKRAARVAKLKIALAQATFMDHELMQLETIAFGAYGRTKLGGR